MPNPLGLNQRLNLPRLFQLASPPMVACHATAPRCLAWLRRCWAYVLVALGLLGANSTVEAGCGDYTVLCGGAGARHAGAKLAARPTFASAATAPHAQPFSRSPCANGECQRQSKLPELPPLVVNSDSQPETQAIPAPPRQGAPSPPSTRRIETRDTWANRLAADAIFEPPR